MIPAYAPAVRKLIHEVADNIMMPRFQQLALDEIVEKMPGDLVTVIDRESEARLTEGLLAILPDSRVVGEEATAADPSLLDRIGEGVVWIVDPLDGTANYAEGKWPFAIMVALAIDGVTEAGFVYDPVKKRMCEAVAGVGAFVNGERITARSTGQPLPVGALPNRFLTDEERQDFERRMEGRFLPVPIPGCAGEQYPRLVLGENDVALFWRALPWDHAPGALFLTEAGGRIARFDGTPYRVDDRRTGLIAAASPALWDEAAKILVG
ncbi:inositol monophosphatase [Sphingomonas oleivorans]|uniref:Inositol monophosphatase n=1 Tax=Sphingomonas oleivorans TaxID=1735121 RepID=A0A2T5FTM5_9SPHN|nr:inositol monophosphatase [Sphingomonas oleivorans]PTQ07406.1 inositol monophosphatase [Sphingomonas oleivorans]